MRRIYLLAACLLAAAILVGLTACSSGDKETKYLQTAYSPGDYFVTNIRDSHKLLKTQIVLTFEVPEDSSTPGTPDADTMAGIKNANHLIRDCIIGVLSAKTEDDLRDPDAMNIVRDELLDELVYALELNSLTNVSFEEFVWQ